MSEHIEANVAIIGAGPAGTAAAAHLGQLGVKDVVLVDKHDFPRDKTCGSGISPKGIQVLKELGVWTEVEKEAYWIKGLRLVTPNDRESFLTGGEKANAIVCNRRIFDHQLLKAAQGRGVRFIPHFVAKELIDERGRVQGVVARDGRTIRAKHTMIAGGAHCRLGAEARPSRQLIHAIMGWWEGVPFTANHVEMAFDRMLEPYYGWLFPENDRVVNIGITYPDSPNKPNARELFSRFLDKHYKTRLRAATQIGDWKGHPVAYSLDIEKLTSPGKLIVGEAGMMTHPATAEGIYQGMKSGMLGAEAVRDILLNGASEARALARYERRCRRSFLLSFWSGELFRRAVRTQALDWVVSFSERPIIKNTTAKILASL